MPSEGWLLVIHPRPQPPGKQGPLELGGRGDREEWGGIFPPGMWLDRDNTPLRHIHMPAARWQHKLSTALLSKKRALFFFTKLSPQEGV